VIAGQFVEVIRRGAFRRSLETGQGRNLVALFNHNTDLILGRRSNGTLKVREDSRGLAFELDIAPTSTGNDVLKLLRRADVVGCSFRFGTVKDAWKRGATKDDLPFRELLEVEIDEITLTPMPAYESTSVSIARSSAAHRLLLADGAAAARRAARLRLARLKGAELSM
jgi:HK97 family phage prohead protease